ncbi:MAG: FtsQ-type POTRA domain-containing protein [Eubacteriales bacterium]
MVTYRAEVKESVKLNIGGSIFFILLLLLVVYVLIGSSFFEIQKVEVKGNDFYTTEKIKSLAGIDLHENIFKVNLSAASSRIKKLSMIREAEVKRDLPSGVIISIVEREPVAFLFAPPNFILIDEEGVYCRKGKVGEADLPVITGFDMRIPPEGQAVQNQFLTVVLEVVKNLPQELNSTLSEINVDKNKKITVYTLDGIQCRMGLPDDIARKGDVLGQVLDKLEDREIDYIDLSSADCPVIKYE